MGKIKQINKLNICFNKTYNKFQVVTPDKRVLEEFDILEQAEECAKRIRDFREKKTDKIYTNNIDKLCQLVNNKYNLKNNEIGSIEHHQDMCENSIVQIANQYRGTRQLVCGENKLLINYLRGILEDRIKLNIEKVG